MSNFAPKDDNWNDDYPTPVENVLSIHQANMFCPDMSCPCKSDDTLIAELAQAIERGEVTEQEAIYIYRGGLDGYLGRLS